MLAHGDVRYAAAGYPNRASNDHMESSTLGRYRRMMARFRIRKIAVRHARSLGLGVAAVIGFLGIAIFVLMLAPDWFAGTKNLDAAQAGARQGVRTASLALLAGAIGVVGAIYTARGFALSRAGQLTDRFTKAIEQLGRKELDIRLGGIYALERIARDSKEDHPQVVEVLTAYVREHALLHDMSQGDPGPHESPAQSLHMSARTSTARLPTDLQAVLTVLGRRTLAHEVARPPLDLSLTYLQGANLQGANLHQADLSGANLQGANLQGGYLQRADFTMANLSGADLTGAKPAMANLTEAILCGANLTEANLTGADLRGADLAGANLSLAELRSVDFRDAHYDRETAWPEEFRDPQAKGLEPWPHWMEARRD